MRTRLFYLFLCFLAVSCAVHYPYVSDYPLTPEIFRSHDGNLTGRVPHGWFCSLDDTLAPALAAWLIKDDFSAALTFREVRLDPLTVTNVRKEGLSLLASISYGMNGGDGAVSEDRLQEFAYGSKQYVGYEIGTGTRSRRIVVFTSRGKYYECEIKAVTENWAPAEMNRLFTIQQSVLASLNF